MTSITSLSLIPSSSTTRPTSFSSSPSSSLSYSYSTLFKSSHLKQKSLFLNLFPSSSSSPRRKNPTPFTCCYNDKNQEKGSFSLMNTINVSGFPVSLRIIQMKRRLSSNSPETVPLSLELSIIKSISTLLLMVDELLKYKGDSIDSPVVVSREMSDSFLVLFKNIFFQSPNLFFGFLDLVAGLIVFSVGKYSPKVLVDSENRELSDFDRTRIAYESLIFNDPDNSLVLCNYAQFLYQIANDDDKAEELFKRAIQLKPVDGEAWSEYGLFLWQKRGDVEAAEEAFIAAIEVEPRNSYYESRYAWFLWETGGSDTCFPLTPTA